LRALLDHGHVTADFLHHLNGLSSFLHSLLDQTGNLL